MQGYLLKVLRKDSRPPVWWRCYISAGISFSSLSLILDALTGQNDTEAFSFMFLRIARVYEPDEKRPLKADYYHDAADASGVFLPEYFDCVKSFSYTNGKTEYRIEIEKDIQDYPFSGPVISKMRVPAGFDVEGCVSRIQDGFRFEVGDPVYLTRKELLVKENEKVITIPCVEKFFACDNAIQRSTEKEIKKTADLLRTIIQDKQLNTVLPLKEETEYPTAERQTKGFQKKDIKISSTVNPGKKSTHATMEEILGAYPKSALDKIARRIEVPRYKGMTSKTLARELTHYLLEPVIIRRDFYMLNDEELQTSEEAIRSEDDLYTFPEERREAVEKLCYLGYLAKQKNMLAVWIPEELKEVYPIVNTEMFQEKRQKIQWIMKIMNRIIPVYYGEIPMNRFCRLCRRTDNPEMKPEEVPGLIKFIQEDFVDVQIDNNLICSDYYIEHPEIRKQLAEAQSGKPYYIMRQNEISELLEYGYPVKEYWHNRMLTWLIEKGKNKEEAMRLVSEIHQQIALAYTQDDILNYLEQRGIREVKMDEFSKIYERMKDNTPCIENRGYSPAMMRAR